MLRFVVAYAAVWPILVHTVYGIRGVDRMLYDVAATSGVSGMTRVARVSVPAALPGIATGIRVGAAIALVVCVTAEFFVGTQGSARTCRRSRLRTGFRSCMRRPPDRAPRPRHRRGAQERRAARPVLGGRGTGARTVSARAVARLRGVFLGALVFVAALAIWEAWARSAESFSSSRRQRGRAASLGCLAECRLPERGRREPERLAAGYAIGATAAVFVGLAMGSSPRVRSTLGPTTEFFGRSR